MRHFFNLADEAGFHLPEDVRMVRVWVNRTPEKDRKWIMPELLSIVALAQHHGVPTRLLDWSRNAYKAALFAALGALDRGLDGGRLSVWATSIRSVERYGSFSDAPFTVVTASGGLNRHLAAQEGVFTYSGQIKTNDDEVDRRSLDEIVSEFFNRKAEVIKEPWFHHVTLPHSQASELCRELLHQGISYSSIYPNLDAVVKTMKFVRSRAPLP